MVAVDVLVVGDVLMDYQCWVEKIPSAGDEEKIKDAGKSIGGSALNAALALQWQGVNCAFGGYVGRDETGSFIVGELEKIGLNLSALQYGERTGYCLTMIDKTGERTMFADRAASKQPLEFTPGLQKLLASARLFFLTGYYLVREKQAEFSLKAARRVKDAGGLVALDPSPDIGLVDPAILAEMFSLTDIILPNERELAVLGGTNCQKEAIEFLMAEVPCIGLKLGPRGSLLSLRRGFELPGGGVLTENKVWREAAAEIKTVDTTGAGDAFNGGFLASFLKKESPPQWLKTANALAAEVIKRQGAATFYFEKGF